MTWKSIKQNQASRNHTPLNLKKAKAGGTPKADPKEVSQLKLNARNAMRQFAPNPRAVARRFDADSRSLESVPQSGERIGDAASGSAELPASTGEFSSRKNGLDLHNGDVPQGQGSLATVEVGSNSAAADTSGEPGAFGYGMKNAAPAEIKFPLCDAAVRKMVGSDWDLADAILAECCETRRSDGVRNESYSKLKAMRQEIAANHGVQLSFERILTQESRVRFSTRSSATGCFARSSSGSRYARGARHVHQQRPERHRSHLLVHSATEAPDGES